MKLGVMRKISGPQAEMAWAASVGSGDSITILPKGGADLTTQQPLVS